MNARENLLGYTLAATPNAVTWEKADRLADAFRDESVRDVEAARDVLLTQRDNPRNMVLAECDVIDAEAYGQHDEDDDGKREPTARIRATVEEWLRHCQVVARAHAN